MVENKGHMLILWHEKSFQNVWSQEKQYKKKRP